MSGDLFSLLPDEPAAAVPVDTIQIFVDEAGDPTLFNAAGEVIVETTGCSRFFMTGKVEVDNPALVAAEADWSSLLCWC